MLFSPKRGMKFKIEIALRVVFLIPLMIARRAFANRMKGFFSPRFRLHLSKQPERLKLESLQQSGLDARLSTCLDLTLPTESLPGSALFGGATVDMGQAGERIGSSSGRRIGKILVVIEWANQVSGNSPFQP
jgi:hypothetical protein